MEKKLKDFLRGLDDAIDWAIEKKETDYLDAYKRCKKCILNILEGRAWNEKE